MIPLGVLASAHVPATGDLVITESFNQPDSSTIGPDLSWTERVGEWSTVSNTLRLTASVANPIALVRADVPLDANQYAQVLYQSVIFATSSASLAGVAVRCQGDGIDPLTLYAATYGVDYAVGSTPELRIRKIVSGTVTTLATASGDIPQPFTLRLEASGDTLTALVDGTPALSTTDNSITAGGTTGILGQRRTSGVSWSVDDFEAGEL